MDFFDQGRWGFRVAGFLPGAEGGSTRGLGNGD